MKTITHMNGLEMPETEIPQPEFIGAVLAAGTKIRGFKGTVSTAHLDTDEEDKVETNSDLTLGKGYWVRIWLFVSQDEVESAGDPTP